MTFFPLLRLAHPCCNPPLFFPSIHGPSVLVRFLKELSICLAPLAGCDFALGQLCRGVSPAAPSNTEELSPHRTVHTVCAYMAIQKAAVHTWDALGPGSQCF